MNKINLSVQGNETGKAVYEKPTSQMYELEVEGAILQASGTPSTTNQVFGESDDSVW